MYWERYQTVSDDEHLVLELRAGGGVRYFFIFIILKSILIRCGNICWGSSTGKIVLFYTSEVMGSSMVDVKADEPNDESTACLIRSWADESNRITVRIK